MHYLKCSNCGHMNEITGEYMVFCSSCHKKLKDNYTDWKSINPDRTFNDYLNLVCVSGNEISSKPVKPKSKHRGLKIAGAGCLVVLILIVVGGYFIGSKVMDFIRPGKTSEEIFTKDWSRHAAGSTGLTLEIPGKLVSANLPIQDNIRQYVEQQETYLFKAGEGFNLFIYYQKYKPVVQKLDVQGSADSFINGMKNQPGTTDFNYTEDMIDKNGIPGFLQKGTFKSLGMNLEFVNVGYISGVKYWRVYIACQEDDEVGKAAAQRIIDSIEINPGL